MDLPQKWKKLTNSGRRVRKRAKYSGIDREEARASDGVKSATDTRPVGDRLSLVLRVRGGITALFPSTHNSHSLINRLNDHVATMDAIGSRFYSQKLTLSADARIFNISPALVGNSSAPLFR